MNPEVAVPLFVVAGLVVVLYLWRSAVRIKHHRRSKLAMQVDDQSELSWTSSVNASLKKHVLYAPLFSKRHSREFRFLRLHMGSVPLRLEVILLLIYLALNIAFVVVVVDWWSGFSKKMFQLKYAAGHLAVMNTPGLVLSAGRNNPLIPLLGISFDTFNFMHRWVGRVIAANAVIHMGAVLANQAYLRMCPDAGGKVESTDHEADGMNYILNTIWHMSFYICGLVVRDDVYMAKHQIGRAHV